MTGGARPVIATNAVEACIVMKHLPLRLRAIRALALRSARSTVGYT